MTDDVTEEVAFAIYREFARIADPDYALKRWRRLQPALRDQYRREAQAAIQAYRAATGGHRR